MRRRRGWYVHKLDLWTLESDRRARKNIVYKVAAAASGGRLAWVATVVIGSLVSLLVGAFRNTGALFIAAWRLGGVSVYHLLRDSGHRRDALRSRARRVDVHYEDEDGEPEQQVTDATEGYLTVGEVLMALAAGLGLALASGLALQGTVVAEPARVVLPALAGLLAGGSVYAVFRRRAARRAAGPATDRQVRAQIRRVRVKCGRLARQAGRVGGVFENLSWQAPLLAEQARELGDALLALRRAEREAKREDAGDALGTVTEHHSDSEAMREELDAARRSQQRLEAMVERNRRQQRRCLMQLERIEDLVDGTRLEITTPLPVAESAGGEESIVTEVETEMQAAREALAEVQGHGG
jgi:hypothetical protein